MKLPDYNSPSDLKMILDTNGFSMQKKFGQNFLINESARIKLIDALDINENTTVWEIGPGLGAMTSEILKRKADLTVFEIDKGFIKLISQYFEPFSAQNKFKIIEGDVLKNWKKQSKIQIPQRCFGNLPYNIAATFVADTIENNIRFEKCVFTVQKEVALRMAAKPGDENYSSFSVLCNWAYDVKPLMDLTGSNFWPKPNVDSRAVVMTPKNDFPGCKDISLFIKVNRALFSSRRKNVRNNLSIFLHNNDLTLSVLNQAGVDPKLRAEVLQISDVLKIADVIYEVQK